MINSIKNQFKQQLELLQDKKYKKPAFEAYNMKRAFVTLDQAFEYVGDNSKYQQRITLLLCIQFLFYSFFVMGMPYLLQNPSKYCTDGICIEYPNCNNRIDSLIGFDSIAKEFGLFCNGRKAFIAALFFVGQMFGGFTFPILANIFGRRKILLFGMSLGSISILVGSLCHNLLSLYALFFIAGFGLSGYETVVYVYITEISALRFRSIASSLLIVIWSSSMLIYPFIVDILQSWRLLMMWSIGVPLLITVVLDYFYFVESPRWLISKQQYDECRRVFRFMSIFNKRRPFEFNFMEELDKFNSRCVKVASMKKVETQIKLTQQSNQNAGYWELFKRSKLLIQTLILVQMWFLRYFTYYGLQFSVSTFGISMTTTLRMLALVELMTGMSSLYFKLKYPRIVSLQFCLLTMILSATLSYIDIPSECQGSLCWQQILHLLSAILIKASITIYNSMLNTYTGEAYVTTVRSYGYGVCMTFGQLGSTFAPLYVSYVQEIYQQASAITIVGLLALIALGLTWFLQETYKKDMYDNLTDEVMATQTLPLINQDMQFDEIELQQLSR
ncbi:unnamed protein product [Paramecium primaurelia]|uniref:Major facilitator superfamily (MFS) profile domain-containing protein n=1 Tax=Paramecium primaurelia TaxID=5886 RepID=A0A8S1PA48_PARPR|nr:unnamed protein product [Paramecium primaurelia]